MNFVVSLVLVGGPALLAYVVGREIARMECRRKCKCECENKEFSVFDVNDEYPYN